MKRFNGFAVLLLLLGLIIGLGQTPAAEAGIYDADAEVTYKEYWINHSEFTGGCTDEGLPTNPNGSFYAEPEGLGKCPKEMELTIPDDFSGALRAELYVDMWRTDDDISPRLRINNLPTVYTPPRGYDWSRTPWIIDIPLSALQQGTNYFLFWAEGPKYHIYDAAVRIYHDGDHPLVAAPGGDTTPPDGALIDITADLGTVTPAYDGGNLIVNNNLLTFKAHVGPNVDSDTKGDIVEFHAYYDGYDDDNDGETHDWHNVNRNNWNPGGKGSNPAGTGSTLNNIANVLVTDVQSAAGHDVTVNWKVDYIINQSGVRFKIRLLDGNGNVREGAGGVTPDYKLLRNYPVVAYTMPNFDDFGLHMGGSRPDIVNYNFPLPADFDDALYQDAYLLGMYWNRPFYSLNGSKPASIRQKEFGVGEDWELGVREFDDNLLNPGNNGLDFLYNAGSGTAVEHPGPMIVLKGTVSGSPDGLAPYIHSRNPAPSATNVDIFAPINIQLRDQGVGVDANSIVMSVDENLVEPETSGPATDLTVSYQPDSPFPPNTPVKVTIYACDLWGNCMPSAVEYTFTTEPPDLTPPVIFNVNADTTNTTATVTWSTDESTTTKIEYGLTNAYEKPAVTDGALVTQHSVTLEGLQPDSAYNFRLSGTDFNNNTTTTPNMVFHTKRDPGVIKSAEFSDCVLDTSIWSYINPKGDSPLTMTGTAAQIAVASGSSHDLWKQGLQSPRLMQFVTDQDFDVEVKFDSVVTKKTQTMGILVQQDVNNWLRFNFQNDGPNTDSIIVIGSTNNNPVLISTTPVTQGASNYLRVNRAGSFWNVQYSTDGTNWTLATTVTRTLTMSQIGVFAGNTGPSPAFTAHIDYFENLAQPLSGNEEGITLNVTKVGVGDVTRSPEKATYACNETVVLTADPAPDWDFVGWSGGINSTDLSDSITLTKTQNVVATFVNDTLYTMNVAVESLGNGIGGSVTKDPDQGTYSYGDEVVLQANPTPGWSFMGWSGDWSGVDPAPTVPITGNMDITATFDEDEYTLEALIIADGVGAGGTLTVEPVQDTYLYGEEVTLTVAPEPGWTFVGWEGEGVSGTDLQTTISMTQDVVAFAHLVQNQYELDINVFNDGVSETDGNGVVKDPDKETYGHGEVVTLAAVAEDGWLFAGWSGDLVSQAITETLIFTDHMAITATFTQQTYTVTVTTEGPGTVTIEPQKPAYVYGDVVTLTPVPAQGYDFALWSGDVNGTQAPLFLAITQDFSLEALFIPDLTPIEILDYDVEVLPGGTLARITWTTDVPGTSKVDYGETEFYEGGSVSEEPLVTDHEVVLSGLSPETLYFFQITSVDEFDNAVQSDNLSFSTSSSSGLISDDFSACELNNFWTWVDPLGDSSHSVSGHQAEITVPADAVHNIWSTTGIDVPRLMQPSNNTDFTIEVKFDSVLTEGGAIQGLVIEQDDQNFMRFDFYLRTYPDLPSEVVVYAATVKNLVPGNISNKTRLNDVDVPLYMRVVRSGNDWQQWYKLEGGDWIKSVEFTFETEVKRVGVFAGNTTYKGVTPGHTAVVDYFFNTASPIEPEDSRYVLNINILGSGNVAVSPDKPGYYCGEPVTLTATGANGWSFAGWGGDLSGSNPTRNVSVLGDMNITANFEQGDIQHTLVLPMIVNRP